jgi:surface polysaccharide O-acyltransferase-like enzyme
VAKKYKDKEFFWLNDMRFLAAIAVIFVHVSQGIMKLAPSKDSIIWWASNFYQVISYWAVPVFVMISGALLLNPKRVYISSKEFYKKRVRRLVPPIIFWSIVYIFWSMLKARLTHTEYGFYEIVGQLIKGEPYYHMWYVYMVLGLYLITPYLRKIVINSTKKELLFISLFLILISMIYYYISPEKLEVPMFLLKSPFYIGYFILGYIIMDSKLKVPIYIYIFIFITTILINLIGAYYIDNPYDLYNNFSPTMILTAVSLMFIIKSIHTSIPISTHIREKLASFSLGAYLIHPLILSIIKKFNYFNIDLQKYAFIAIPFFVLVITIVSLLIAYGFSKIKILQRYI